MIYKIFNDKIFKPNKMKLRNFLSFLGLVVFGILLTNSFVLSQTIVDIRFTDPITGGGDFDEMLERILSWLWPLSLIIGVMMLIISGYYFIFSGGDPTKVTTGKRILIYTLVAIAIITTSTGIVDMVRQMADPALEPPQILINFISHIFGLIIVVTVIMIIISGYFFMTSGGDPAKVDKAKKTLTYSLVGLAIALTSRGIIAFVTRILEP